MKKLRIVGLVAMLALAATFVGCKNGANPEKVSVKKVSVADLPASGATTSVTEENFATALSELMEEGAEDPILAVVMSALFPSEGSFMSVAKSTTDVSSMIPSMPENLKEFIDAAKEDGKKIDALKAGESVTVKNKLNKKAEVTVDALGLKASVDSIAYGATVSVDSDKVIDIKDAYASAKASASADLTSFDSILKGAAANVAAAVEGDAVESAYSVSGSVGVAASAGVSFCTKKSKIGGKLVANVKVVADADLDKAALEKLEDGENVDELSKLFSTFTVNISFCDDAGNVTYNFADVKSYKEFMEIADLFEM